MKYVISLFFCLSIFSQAQAERVILRNPSEDLLKARKDLNVLKRLTVGGDRYLVLETRYEATLSKLKFDFHAQDAFNDIPIEFDRPIVGNSSQEAWQVKSLQYGRLPKSASGQGVTVAILDTGVNYKNPALSSRMWVNSKEIPNNRIDDDFDGLVDDVYGFNFIGPGSSDPIPSAGEENEHGTHCAGIVAAEEDLKTGAQGIAPGAKIMALKIMHSYNSNVPAFLTDALEAIQYAVAHGARILSNSWFLGYNAGSSDIAKGVQLMKSEIAEVNRRGVIFVVAAGNDNDNNDEYMENSSSQNFFPAGLRDLPYLVVVASSQEDGSKSDFSNYGPTSVMIAAPGSNILSTFGLGWRSFSGTSMATPLIAGILARGLSAGMTPSEAIRKLKETADRTEAWKGKVQSGLVNPMRFLGVID